MPNVKETSVNIRLNAEDKRKLERVQKNLATRFKVSKVTQADAIKHCISAIFDINLVQSSPED